MIKGSEALKDLKESCRIHMGQLVYILQEDKFDIIEKELKEHKQYTAIEEELGIDLVTLFKALKNGICYNAGINAETKKMSIYECKPLLQFASKALVMVDNSVCKGEFYYFYFKDYGKTWALTKEELL